MSAQSATPSSDVKTVEADKKNATTTYIGWHVAPDGQTAARIGETTVRVGQGNKAQQKFLAQLAEADPGATSFTLAICSDRSWQQDVFVPAEPVAPRFKTKA